MGTSRPDNEKQKKALFSADNKRLIIITVVFLLLIAAVTVAVTPWLNRLTEPDTQEKVKAWVDAQGIVGWLGVLGIQILQIIIAFIPGEPVEILAGVLFGTWGGLFLCMIGSIIASTAVFAITRRFGLPLIYRMFGKEKVDRFTFLRNSQNVETAAFLLFLIPGTPKDMLTYVAGVSKIKMSRFLLITTFARIPSVITGTIAGDALLSNWKFALAVFLFTGIIGLLGIRYKDRVIAYTQGLKQKKRPPHID